MDKSRVVALVEGEIMRKINMAKLCRMPEYSQHIEVADALTIALNAYKIRREEKIYGPDRKENH